MNNPEDCTKFVCNNCGDDKKCFLFIGEMEDENINDMFKCQYSSRFYPLEG